VTPVLGQGLYAATTLTFPVMGIIAGWGRYCDPASDSDPSKCTMKNWDYTPPDAAKADADKAAAAEKKAVADKAVAAKAQADQEKAAADKAAADDPGNKGLADKAAATKAAADAAKTTADAAAAAKAAADKAVKDDEVKICCQAMTPSCLACKAGLNAASSAAAPVFGLAGTAMLGVAAALALRQ
jgi:hypothetical protein